MNKTNQKTGVAHGQVARRQFARRQFVTQLLGAGVMGRAALGALPAAGLGWSSVTHAQSNKPYKLIEPAMPTQDKSKVEVLEFFWFGCPHCFAFEPAINAWKDSKPDYVDFVREAPPLNPGWEQHSRTFYAAQALGITDGMFDQTFDNIHKNKQPMRDPKKIAKYIASLDLGVSADEFQKAMESFAVETALKRSVVRAQQAGIRSVPSIVINGKYRTGNTIAGGHQGIIDVINERAAFEHSAA